MHFTKMHGLGNDYLYVFGEVPNNADALSVQLSERHFGVGSDGMIWISPSETADFKMRIFNADGSEAKMCGNGIRCVGKYVYEKGLTGKTHLQIETLSGIRTLDLKIDSGKVQSISVDMGRASCGEPLELLAGGQKLTCIPVSVGNPHAVFPVDDLDAVPLERLGPMIEHHEAFPDGVNAEFIEVLNDHTLRMRVWERGSGITMACGTGACASAAAAIQSGFCLHDSHISVLLDGGALDICISTDKLVTMTGPAEIIYEGDVQLL